MAPVDVVTPVDAQAADPDAGSSGALAGVRVVEVGHLIAGPFCGHLFADHGAEVVKVEPPQGGDVMRQWGGVYRGVGLYWPVIGRGKKSVTLDLRRPEGQDAFRDLVRTADVVVENFRPGRMEAWGLGWDELRAVNPGLVFVRVSGFGQTGPYRDRAAFGSIGEAIGGIRHVTGDPDAAPSRTGVSIGDALAGTHAFTGALLALHARNASPAGEGQVVDVALYESVWLYMESVIAEYDKLGVVRGRTGPLLPGIAPSNVYPTRTGDWAVIGANQDTVFTRFAAAVGHPEWAAPGSPYATHAGRWERHEALDQAIAEWTGTRTIDEVLDAMNEAGVPASKIFTAADIAADPHYAARHMIVRVAEPNLDGEDVAMPGVVPKLLGTPGSVRRGAPRLGEHNDEVWEPVLGAERLARLREASTI